MANRIIIVGGGAAGMFAAAAVAEGAGGGAEVIVLERSGSVLAKVSLSGGGRCNLSNINCGLRNLPDYYPRGGRELRGPLSVFGVGATVAWFEVHGVPLKTEADGRVFPISDRAADIVECLKRTATRNGVRIITNAEVIEITPLLSRQFALLLASGERFIADRVLLATGGGTSAHYALLRGLGHEVVTPVPALFGFRLHDWWLGELSGTAVVDTEVTLPAHKIRAAGSLLITHWGVSGPATLCVSSQAARVLAACQYVCPVRINWVKGLKRDQVLAELRAVASREGRRRVGGQALFGLTQRFWGRVVQAANIPADQVWARLGRDASLALAGLLTQSEWQIAGRGQPGEEMVTCGGVELKEVNFKTMESRVCPGLFLSGEVLNIDGLTGGYNLQAAWTTGRLAACAVFSASH